MDLGFRVIRRLGGRALAVALLVLAVVSACSDIGTDRGLVTRAAGKAQGTERPAAPAGPATEIDFTSVVNRVRVGFRARGGVWIGGDRTYTTRAAAGAFSVTPRHRPADGDGGQVVTGAPLTFRTTEIGREHGPSHPLDDAEPALRRDGGIDIDRGAAVENVVNGAGTIEQSWTFAERPEGDGDLVVRVAVEGQAYTGATEAGHHFADPETGVGVRYGAATWVDASGARSRVGVGFDGAALVLSVPREVVDAAAYPAVLDPTISPEFGMDTPVVTNANGSQTRPAIASDGTNYLVVWEDQRAGAQTEADVYATRVSAAGAVLDPYGIPISTATGAQLTPAVAFNGSDFLVVWSDSRGSSAAIYGTRVTPSGSVISPSGLSIMTTASTSLTQPAIASNGSSFMVIWNRAGDIWGTRVSATNAILDPSGFLVNSAAGSQTQPAIAFDGTNYLAAWTSANDIYGSRLSQTGSLLDVIPIATGSSAQTAPAVAATAAGFLVAWADATPKAIKAARVAPDGTVLDPNGLTVTTGAQAPLSPRLVTDGTGFLAAWQDFRNGTTNGDIYGARLDAAGTVLDPQGFPIAQATGTQSVPTIAFGGTGYMAVWQDDRALGNDVFAARIGTDGSVLDDAGVRVSTSANAELTPAVAYGGGNYLVVWSDDRSGTSFDVFGTRVSPAGTILDPAGIAISSAPGAQGRPAVASCGTEYLVLWDDGRNTATTGSDIYAARVDLSGAVLDPAGIAVATTTSSERAPAVSCRGSVYLGVWLGSSNGGYGTQISSNGTVSVPGGVQLLSGNKIGVAVASNGTNYLALGWTDDTVSATLVIAPQSIVGTATVYVHAGSSSEELYAASVASNGTDYLVSWTEYEDSFDFVYRTNARTVTSNLQIGATTTFGTPAKSFSSSTIKSTHDGFRYLLAWDEPSGQASDILGAYTTGASAPRFSIANSTTYERWPAAASNGAGQSLLVYTRFDDALDQGARRVRGRLLSAGVAGNPCAAGADCNSGYCVDGVCCDTSCTGVCSACTAAKKGGGADGTCGPIGAGLDPDNECAAQTASTCGRTGFCSGAGACELFPSGTDCGSSCSSSTFNAKTCNGAGTCVTQTGVSCVPYACDTSASPTVCRTSCTMDSHCSGGNVCINGACGPKLANGGACTQGSQCQSTRCVDGVCCDLSCSGVCQACSAAKKGGGVDGACGPIAAGQDPDNECAQQQSTTCGTNGSCNGAGACALWPQGQDCGTTCSSGAVTLRQCNGTGTCVTSAGPSCAPYVCSPTSCYTKCYGDSYCASGHYCPFDGGSCLPKGTLGAACTATGATTQCISGWCSDGVCCDTSCNTKCRACTAALKGSGADGTCGNIAAGTDPSNECSATAPSTCGTTGVCNGLGACEIHPTSTICATVCSGDGVNAKHCNTSSQCVDSPVTSCAPYGCSNGACNTSCTTSAQCAAGAACAGGVCVGLLGLGQLCGDATACASGFCVDGVCCNSACNAGACDGCSLAAGAAVDGTCALLTGTACDDGNALTKNDVCTAGACAGVPLCTGVVCSASDPCHVAGTCDPTTGVCSNPSKPDGATCDDGNALTKNDVCTAGACAGVPLCTGVVCTALDECHVAGTCDPTTGACSSPNAADGTPCTGGTCQAGICSASPDGGMDAGAGGGTTTSSSSSSGSSSGGGAGGGATTSSSSSSSSSGGGNGGGTTTSSSSSSSSGSTTASSSSSGAAGGNTGTGATGTTGTSGTKSPDGGGGCGCRVAGESDERGSLAGWGLAVLGFAIAARRRRGRPATAP